MLAHLKSEFSRNQLWQILLWLVGNTFGIFDKSRCVALSNVSWSSFFKQRRAFRPPNEFSEIIKLAGGVGTLSDGLVLPYWHIFWDHSHWDLGPLHQETGLQSLPGAEAESLWCPDACGTPGQGMSAEVGQIVAWEALQVWKRGKYWYFKSLSKMQIPSQFLYLVTFDSQTLLVFRVNF